MSSVDNKSNECQGGVCEVKFKPMQMAKRSFQNLKAMASDIIEKVKDSIAGDDIDNAVREVGPRPDQNQLDTTKERSTGTESGCDHLSAHSSAILNSFIQNNWRPPTAEWSEEQAPEAIADNSLKMVHVRPRPPQNMIKAPRFSNPWRYDSHH